MRAFYVTVRTPGSTNFHFAIGESASVVYDFTAADQNEEQVFGITVVPA